MFLGNSQKELAEEFMANLGPDTKTHTINDSRKNSNAKYRAAAISMASITSLVTILNWLLGFIVESRQGSVEVRAASIISGADRTEIKNEKEEGEKRRKNEGANAKEFLDSAKLLGR
ncbi:hypothetical protein TWF102_000150 [Orbilia oligospora]|uniref:Uncharacterized protein n=1 Tax=Orbilia oligospora TaxID=2813651 RepID=A0A7C8JDW8_ORBOL|nr:hypothetical protein TWF706_004624 [Orbilia oligospora]KAF3113491.1 hypothetical protein TWF102_000150 [Orbilia oligospora]KAF3115243.1 hypothetical protein TWF103_011504 [Orbilia oligospora]KAF3129067.1 hypothetical protein TWF703_009097 [Orbilia oligospora]KAF3150421.1 hypothetical protein TWF594_009066 [Orbilia oligospora]